MQTLDYREAWSLGTYRRFDSLVAPAFYPPRPGVPTYPEKSARPAELLRLTTDLPTRLISFADYLAGNSAQLTGSFSRQLALYLRYLAAPQTFEPLNSYKVHTPVPSVRCLFPYRLMLLVREAEPVLYEYHPNYHALEKIAQSPDYGDLLGNADLAVIGISLYWKLADKYGDFTPFPVNLEMGGLKCQAEHLLSLCGWQQTHSEIEPDLWNRQLGCVRNWETVAFALPARTQLQAKDLEQLPRETHQLAIWQARDDLETRFTRLRPLVDMFQAGAAPAHVPSARPIPVTSDSDAAASAVDILQLFRSRNSGNDAFGFAPACGGPPENLLPQLLYRLRRLRARRPLYAGEAAVKLWFLWLDGTSAPIGLFDSDGARASLRREGAQLVRAMQDALPNQILKFNMAAMTLSVLMTVDLPEAHQAHGPAMLRRVHTAAGMLGQDLNLAATDCGLFSRPVRMFRESAIEDTLQLPGQLVYQVLMGFNRRTNIKIGLL